MSTMEDIIKSLPYPTYGGVSVYNPIGSNIAEQSLISRILFDPDYDTGPLVANDFNFPTHRLIFDVWKELKDQNKPRSPKEVSEVLRQRVFKETNDLELLANGYLMYLHDFHSYEYAHVHTIMQNAVIRKLKGELEKEEEPFPDRLELLTQLRKIEADLMVALRYNHTNTLIAHESEDRALGALTRLIKEIEKEKTHGL